MSNYAQIDAFGLLNQDSQFDVKNFKRLGAFVMVSPTSAIGTLIPKNGWVGFGYFAPDAEIAPTTDVQRNPILVRNPMGGPPVTLMEDISDVSAIYETIEPVISDEYIQALHQGSVPTDLTGATVPGSTMSPFQVGASIEARYILIRISEGATEADRTYEVYWHPRVALQNNGFGTYEGRDTRRFRAPVRTWNGALVSAELEAAALSDMGAIFLGPLSELTELITILKAEAAAA